MVYLSTLLISLFVTISLIPIFIKAAMHFQLVDVPDARKVHTTPIPRCGGIAIAIGACLPIVIWRYSGEFIGAYLAGAGVLVAIGILDDYRGLNYRVKFAGQILAAVIVIYFGDIRIISLGALMPDGFSLPGWISWPLTLFAIVAVTNAVNLSDGLDGLAGGICLLSLCCIAYLAHLVENPMVVFLSVSLAGAIFGFLRFNTFPASLFMGDTGSMFLGFSVVTFALEITQDYCALSPFLPLFIVGLPVMDTTAVMCERIANGKSPFMADKNHLHHKLLRMGLFHSESVLTIYVLQGILVSVAVFFRFYDDGFLLAGYSVFFILVLAAFFAVDRFHWRFRRISFLDTRIKIRLRILRERRFFIKIVYKGLEMGLPLLLIISCFMPAAIPHHLPALSAAFLAILSAIWVFRKPWLRNALSLILYLIIPFVVYAGSDAIAPWIDGTLPEKIYHWTYGGLVVFVIATLKLTKRQCGFKVSPLDFLILFIALLAPFITGFWMKERMMAEMVSKTLMLFFSYEVLIGELRGKFGWLTASTGAALAVLAMRG